MSTLQPCQSSEVGPVLEKDDRAAYGERIVATVSQELKQRYGKGFTKSALNRKVKFAKVFPIEGIVHAVHAQKSITSFKADLRREFALKKGAVGG